MANNLAPTKDPKIKRAVSYVLNTPPKPHKKKRTRDVKAALTKSG